MEEVPDFVKNILLKYRQKLAGIYNEQESRNLTYLLFEEYLGWEKSKVHLSYDIVLPQPAVQLLNAALNELLTGKPIQYIIKKAWFNGTVLKVNENVLVPRPETEELCTVIETDHNEMKDRQLSILDIGTGSGCIAIELKKKFPRSKVTADDSSIGALKIAAENAEASQCDISFIHADILDETKWPVFGQYDIVVSNPPYVLESEKAGIHRNVIGFEPAGALFVTDEDPLIFYRAITRFATTHLVPDGRLYFEINEKFGREMRHLVSSFGFNDIRVLKDFNGKDRFVAAGLNQSKTSG